MKPYFEGVTQGGSISPILSTIILDDFINQAPSVIYADDPIFYSNHPFEIKDDPEKGIIINKDKSA
jgi:hypothetical protein